MSQTLTKRESAVVCTFLAHAQSVKQQLRRVNGGHDVVFELRFSSPYKYTDKGVS